MTDLESNLPPLTDAEVSADPELQRLLTAANEAALAHGRAITAEAQAAHAYREASIAVWAHRHNRMIARELDRADAERAAEVRARWEKP